MSQNDQQAQTNPTPAAARETFHQEFFRRAAQFTKDMLILVPELEGLAIVPSWEVPQLKLPHGIISGRNGALRQPQEVMHMAEQLHGVLKIVMENSHTVLQQIDARMGEMAEEIRVRQAKLDHLNAELGRPTPPADAAGGATPESPGPG